MIARTHWVNPGFNFDSKVLGRGFGYDVRGTDVRGGQLTRQFYYRLARVLGSQLPVGSKVFVTGDARTTSDGFIRAAIQGYRESGINVVTTPGPLPTGIATWYVVQKEFDGSLVVSGSHNPVGQNGAKITKKGQAVYGKDLSNLEAPIREAKWRKNATMGTLEKVDVYPPFMSMLSRVFPHYNKAHKIYLDAADGIGGRIIDPLCALGASVIGVNLTPDGRFPTYGRANPTDDKCTIPLRKQVKLLNQGIANPSEKWIGMILDGDGDRVALVTEEGALFEAEKMAAIYYREYLRGLKTGKLPEIYGPHMALDVRATSSTTNMVLNEGGFGYYIQAGYPAHREWARSIIERIAKDRYTGTSAEASGHFFEPTAFYGPDGETYEKFATALVDDGYYMGLKMMQILDNHAGTLHSLTQEIPSLPYTPEKRAEIDGGQKFDVIAQMPAIFKQAFEGQLKPQSSEMFEFGNLRIQHPANGLIIVDGVLAKTIDGASALVRASNTSDKLNFIFEAPTTQRLVNVMETTLGLLKPFEKTAGLNLEELAKQLEEKKQETGA